MSEDAGQYDDRVDTDAVISSASALGLMLRAVRLLTQVKGLFAAKALLALAAIFPPLTVPWFTKIIVDQVILDQPFNATEVRFPPFMLPFLDFVDGIRDETEWRQQPIRGGLWCAGNGRAHSLVSTSRKLAAHPTLYPHDQATDDDPR
jgi:hypothetical protein